MNSEAITNNMRDNKAIAKEAYKAVTDNYNLPPDWEDQMRRVKRVRISLRFFYDLLGGGEVHCQAMHNYLPSDSRILYVQSDPTTSIIEMIVWSSKFSIVPEGDAFPDMMITFSKVATQSKII